VRQLGHEWGTFVALAQRAAQRGAAWLLSEASISTKGVYSRQNAGDGTAPALVCVYPTEPPRHARTTAPRGPRVAHASASHRATPYKPYEQETDMQKLSDIMTRDVQVLAPSSTVQQAAEQMSKLDVGAIPVCDGKKLLGMITDRDIAIRSSAKGQDPKATKVTDVMTAEVAWCFDDASIEDVARTMQSKQIRRLPVVDRNKQLVGIVALADVARSGASDRIKSDGLEGVSQEG
jgi:CBS domain-containing protein